MILGKQVRASAKVPITVASTLATNLLRGRYVETGAMDFGLYDAMMNQLGPCESTWLNAQCACAVL